MKRFVLVADLRRCIGCQTCSAACRQASGTPPGVLWRKVMDVEIGIYPQTKRVFVPAGCQHCAAPPCEDVCPTKATQRGGDGVVTVRHDRCAGCGYCVVACPYQARSLAKEGSTPSRAAARGVSRANGGRFAFGVATKCDFCNDRLQAARERGLTPGVDPEATPACVNACISGALSFGDERDPQSSVHRLLRTAKVFRMHEDKQTEPAIYYVIDDA